MWMQIGAYVACAFVLFVLVALVSAILHKDQYYRPSPDEERAWLKTQGLTDEEIDRIME